MSPPPTRRGPGRPPRDLDQTAATAIDTSVLAACDGGAVGDLASDLAARAVGALAAGALLCRGARRAHAERVAAVALAEALEELAAARPLESLDELDEEVGRWGCRCVPVVRRVRGEDGRCWAHVEHRWGCPIESATPWVHELAGEVAA